MHSFDLLSRSRTSQSVDFAVVSHSHWICQPFSRIQSFGHTLASQLILQLSVIRIEFVNVFRNTIYAIPLFCMYVKWQGSICWEFLPDVSFSLLVECIIFLRRGIESSQIFLVNLWSYERDEMCCSSRNFVGYF
jgi:hypothetical protein